MSDYDYPALDGMELFGLLGGFRDKPGRCSSCGKQSDTLYEVEGYVGTYLECPECFGDDEDEDDFKQEPQW